MEAIHSEVDAASVAQVVVVVLAPERSVVHAAVGALLVLSGTLAWCQTALLVLGRQTCTATLCHIHRQSV